MHVIAFEPENRKLRREFIQFPFRLYQNDPNWVPPLLPDIRQIFNHRKHGFYQHGDALFLLALEGDKTVGRLAVLHNHSNQPDTEQKTAYFYLYETQPDLALSKALFESAAAWAENRGLTRIFGPKGMTPLDGLGLLVEGFDLRPAFGIPYNPAYYPEHLHQLGFQKVSETVSGYLDPETYQLPEKIHKAAQLIQERKDFRVLQLRSRRDLKKAIGLLGAMYNDALEGTTGTQPLSDQDLRSMTQGLLWIAQPELIKLILKGDQPVGFLLAYPDISAGLQATRGRLLPFGWLRLLWEKSHTETLNINGAGVVAEYRGLAATALLFAELDHSAHASGQFSQVEVVQIGTENERMLRELRGIGIRFNKTHALFELEI